MYTFVSGLFDSIVLFCVFWPHQSGMHDLRSPTRERIGTPAAEVCSLNHWTARKSLSGSTSACNFHPFVAWISISFLHIAE